MTVIFDDDFVATACRNVNAHHADDVLAVGDLAREARGPRNAV